MALAASGMLEPAAKVQYICTLVHGETLHQSNSLSADVEGENPVTVEAIILGLAAYFVPVNLLSNKKCVMRCGVRKTR